MKLAIDPGHPTEHGDTGTRAHGLAEYLYTWQMANALVAYLRHSLPDCETILTRSTENEVVSLADRGAATKEFGADLVLSLHVDGAEAQHLRGSSMYYWPGNKVGHEVALKISAAMPEPLFRRYSAGVFAADARTDKWLKRANRVIAPHRATTVLVEMGYCTNHRDLMALLDNTTQIGIMLALVCGVIRFKQLTEVTQ